MTNRGTVVKTALTLIVCGMLIAPITADAGRFRGPSGDSQVPGAVDGNRGQGHGQGTGFVDADGDGINDNRGHGYGRGAGFVDADGDGINDHARMAGYIDSDHDGLNDNYVDADHDGRNDITGLLAGESGGTGYRGGR